MPETTASPATGPAIDPATGVVPGPATSPARSMRWGMTLGIACYVMWGALPLYFPLLEPAGALEIIAHRIVWSLLFCLVLLLATRQLRDFRKVFASRRLLLTLTVGAALMAGNWVIYVLAVTSGHVIDASLGYFINPFVTVLLAVLVLKERLRPTQWVALGFGLAAVIVITVGLGSVPWLSLGLALTFGFYGLIKNRVGPHVAAVPSLAVETAVLTPLALGYLIWLTSQGMSTVLHDGAGHALLLASSGIVTALPLLCFGAAARILPLRVLGMLQYIAPILQLLVGVLVFDEHMAPLRWLGFALVWVALTILTVDAVRASRALRLAPAR